MIFAATKKKNDQVEDEKERLSKVLKIVLQDDCQKCVGKERTSVRKGRK